MDVQTAQRPAAPSSLEDFIDSLSRAAAEILQPPSGTHSSFIDTSGSHHHDALSLLSTLADLASVKSPVKQSQSPPLPPPLQGSSGATPPVVTDSNVVLSARRLRPRAMSESFASEDNWKKSLQIAQNSTDTSGIILPYMLDKYSSIYNKHGRIGVYSREEREVIIARFHQKRKKRVWKKSIRYHCRKNLADTRVRVKGRFVRASSLGSDPAGTTTSAGIGTGNVGGARRKPQTRRTGMEDLLAVAASQDLEDEDDGEGDASAEVSDAGPDSAPHSYTPSSGLELLERAIQFDDEDSRLPPGKRMRRHTIV